GRHSGHHGKRGEQRDDEREAGRSHSGSAAGARRDRLETLTTPVHFWSASTLTSSKSRLAPSSAVICPGPSYGRARSTMCAPTTHSPGTASTSRGAASDVSPPTSGVPVPGGNAGSTASMSNEQ